MLELKIILSDYFLSSFPTIIIFIFNQTNPQSITQDSVLFYHVTQRKCIIIVNW